MTGTRLEIAKALSSFKREIGAKYNETKAVNYKTIVSFCESLNLACGKEIISVKTYNSTLHTYKTHNRLRYADSYKEGVRMEFECKILNTRYFGHSKEQGNSYALTHWFYTEILASPLDFMKKIFDIQ